jgi:hypothetical protein
MAQLAGHHLRVPNAVVEDVLLEERRESVVAFMDDT